jgi:hypothetical protein
MVYATQIAAMISPLKNLTPFLALAIVCGMPLGLIAGEIWIAQGGPGSVAGGEGTSGNPFTVPAGDVGAFDGLINAQPASTAIHLGAGTFLTRGSTAGKPVILKDGSSLVGSGMGLTIVKLADASWASGIGAVLQVGTSGPGAGFHHCVRDLTVDSNFAGQPGAAYSNGIAGVGQSFLVENVELINLGSRSGEAFGIFIGNFAENDVARPSHVIIRNCRVHKPWPDSSAGFSAITPTGNNLWSGVIEGCSIDLSAAPKAQTGGYAFAGSPRGLVIAHNTAIGCVRGVHVDTPGSYAPKAARNVIISNNRFYDCIEAIGIGAPDDAPFRTDHFENFTIESNVIEMVRGGNGISLWGGTTGFQVKNNTITKSPAAPAGNVYRTGIYVSPGAQSHVVTGNRFGPAGDPYFGGINPYTYADAASSRNRMEDNTWTAETLPPKTITSVRTALDGANRPLPSGSSLWTLALGGAQADANPTTSISSSNLDGSDPYNYLQLSRAPGGASAGHNIVLDPDGRSGVHVGTQNAGYLTVGGWMSSNSGLGLAQGARLVMLEGGAAARMGAVTLSSGQAIVRTTAIRANTRIFLTPQQDGGVPGSVRVSSRTAGVSFVIKSSSTTDRSVIGWVMVDPSY